VTITAKILPNFCQSAILRTSIKKAGNKLVAEEEPTGRVALRYLRQYRKKFFKSQGRLAADSGVSKDSISELERGLRRANYETVGRLAKALDLTPHQLVNVNPDAPQP
jgi:DNA-binding XRE family transcriptional regulator